MPDTVAPTPNDSNLARAELKFHIVRVEYPRP